MGNDALRGDLVYVQNGVTKESLKLVPTLPRLLGPNLSRSSKVFL